MIEKSQVLSTVQQVKLRKLELEIEALREQVQGQGNVEETSTVETDNDKPILKDTTLHNGMASLHITYKPVSETVSHLR